MEKNLHENAEIICSAIVYFSSSSIGKQNFPLIVFFSWKADCAAYTQKEKLRGELAWGALQHAAAGIMAQWEMLFKVSILGS